jgi:hypothetical protein
MVAPAAAAGAAVVSGVSRDELMLLNQEYREIYRAASLKPDGSSKRGRKDKHNTATRNWIDTIGFPQLTLGKLPEAHDLAMLRSGPRSGLKGTFLKARDAWSQLHARDPRSQQLTAAEKSGQQTLLAWARINTPDALTHSTAQRGRPESYKLHFGKWRGYTPLQLITLAAGPTWSREQAMRDARATVPPAEYLVWMFSSDFKFNFPYHFYLYLALKEIEAQVNPNPESLNLTPTQTLALTRSPSHTVISQLFALTVNPSSYRAVSCV